MNGLLVLIAAVLLCVLAVSVVKQRRIAAGERRVEADRHSPEQRAQHERSIRRRADVREAHADRARGESHSSGA